MKKFLKGFFILVTLFFPVIPLLFYFWGNWYSFFDTWSLGIVFGIISYTYFLIVLILSARIRFVDRIYGHDRVMIFHGYLAIAGLVCAYIHHWLKEQYFPGATFQSSFGDNAKLIFTTVMILTLLFMVQNLLHRIRILDKLRLLVNIKLGIDYTIFKVFHNFVSIAVVLMGIHIILASSTQENFQRIYFMGGMGSLSLLIYLYHKFIRLIFLYTNKYKVKNVRKMSKDIYQIEMENLKGKRKKKKAGQFGFFRFTDRAISFEEHPFTVSSAPHSETLNINVKELGNFTKKISTIKPGSNVLFDGPYGVFTPIQKKVPLVFIAGGIGITPFISILSSWKDKEFSVPVILIWGARKKEDLIVDNDFSVLSEKNKNFTYIPVLSQDDDWKGAKGYITGGFLKEKLGEILNKKTKFYICGPPILRRNVLKSLSFEKIPHKNVHYELFSL